MAALGGVRGEGPRPGGPLGVANEPSPPENITPWEYDGAPDEPQFDRAKSKNRFKQPSVRSSRSRVPHLDAYVALMDTADDYYYSSTGGLFWYGGCETSEGVSTRGTRSTSTTRCPLFGEDSAMSGPVLNTEHHHPRRRYPLRHGWHSCARGPHVGRDVRLEHRCPGSFGWAMALKTTPG